MEQRRESQRAKRMASKDARHQKQMTELIAKLAQDKKLTDAQRNEILATKEKQYQDNLTRMNQRQKEDAAFFQKINNDPNMTPEQRQEAVKKHLESQKLGSAVSGQPPKVEGQMKQAKSSSGVAVAPRNKLVR
jgi:hypothetical protein